MNGIVAKMSDGQYQLDTRAIELASELKGSLAAITEVLNRHLNDCLEERRNAAAQRATMHAAVNNLSVQQVSMHSQNEKSISRIQNSTMFQIILILLSILGATTTKALGWW